jgi:putative transcriptional regulator
VKADRPAARDEGELELGEALAAVAAALPAAVPPPALRARLLDSLAGPGRFSAFFDVLARHYDLTVAAVRGLLARIDDPAAWEATPSRFIQLIHFDGGPAVAGADAGFVRVAAGKRFPRHSHDGDEMTFVLEGRAIVDGHAYVPGDVVHATQGDVHEVLAGPDRDLVLMVLHRGIDFTNAG